MEISSTTDLIDSDKIGEFIARERVSAKLSRSRLSFLADVNEYNIAHYENGRSQPSFDAVNKLLSALGYEIVIRKKQETRYGNKEKGNEDAKAVRAD